MQDELVTVLGVKVSPETLAKLKKFQDGLQNVAQKLADVGKATTVVSATITGLMKLAGDSAVQLKNLADSTGISCEELQALEYASKSVGVSFDAVKGDIQTLTKELNNPLPGQFNEGLVLLGVSTRDASGKVKKSTEIFADLADKLKGMSTQKAIAWGQKVGISEDTVKLLRQGKAGIDALKAEGKALGAVVPDSAVNGLAEFSKSMSQLAMIGRSLANTFLGLLAPALNKIIDGYKRWSAGNGGIIKSGIEFVAKQIGKAFDFIGVVLNKVFTATGKVGKVFKPIIDIFKKSNILASALTVALGAMVAVGFVKLFGILRMINPWFIAIAVLVEELYTWFTKGFESTGFYKLWGVFEKKFPTVAGIIKTAFNVIKDGVLKVVEILKTLWDIVKPIASAFVDLGAGIIDALKPVASFLLDVLGGAFNALAGIVSSVMDVISGALKTLKEPIEWLAGKISSVGGWLSEKFGGKKKSGAGEWVDNRANVPIENPIKGDRINTALYTSQNVPTGQTVNNATSTTNNNQRINGTTNVYIQAGNSSPNEILGAVKQQYGNSTNVNAPLSSTGGALVQ